MTQPYDRMYSPPEAPLGPRRRRGLVRIVIVVIAVVVPLVVIVLVTRGNDGGQATPPAAAPVGKAPTTPAQQPTKQPEERAIWLAAPETTSVPRPRSSRTPIGERSLRR